MSRDRDARLAATVARGCGFDQPAARLIVRQLPPVTALLGRDDATVRRVLDDPRTRASLVAGVRDAFRDGWQRATMERLRRDHDDWLRAWWLPACSDAELQHLRRTRPLRAAHHRVGWRLSDLPATSGAAELLLDTAHRHELAGHLVVDRRLADAVRRLVDELDDLPAATATDVVPGDVDHPPAGVDPDRVADVGWWSVGTPR